MTTDYECILRSAQIHRKLKTGDMLVDEEFYQERDKWLLEYHVTTPDGVTWALNEFDKVYSRFQ